MDFYSEIRNAGKGAVAVEKTNERAPKVGRYTGNRLGRRFAVKEVPRGASNAQTELPRLEDARYGFSTTMTLTPSSSIFLNSSSTVSQSVIKTSNLSASQTLTKALKAIF